MYQEEINLYKALDNFLTNKGMFIIVPSKVLGIIVKILSKNILYLSILGSKRAKFKVYFVKSNQAAFQQIFNQIVVRKVKTIIDFIFKFREILRVIKQIKFRKTIGKIIIYI